MIPASVEQPRTEPTDSEIVDLFSLAGLDTRIDQMPNALYSVRGQLAQLINGARALLSRFGGAGLRQCDERWYSAQTVTALLRARDHELAELRAAAAATPRVIIRCDTKAPGLIGSAYLDVVRVERNDDGSLTAVTHYWPRPESGEAA